MNFRPGVRFAAISTSGNTKRDIGTSPSLLRSCLRERCGRYKHPTAGCLDSQSVKCTVVPGQRGFDGIKKVNGRKRHILVDTLGLPLTFVVTAADVQNRDDTR